MENDRSKCVFCRIADNLENNEILHSDNDLIVFRDIKPVAKNHFLIVPKVHIKNAKCLTSAHKLLVLQMEQLGKEMLEKYEANVNDALMGFHWPPLTSISHLHLHVIAPISDMKTWHWLQFKPNSMWFVSVPYVLSRL